MDLFDRPMSRRALMRTGAAGALGAYAVGAAGLADQALAARKVQVAGTTLNWLTWSDHYFTKQLSQVKGKVQIGAHVQLISDDSDAYTRVKQGGSSWDMSSEDALWVPLFYKQGLIQSLDLSSLPVAKQLYSVARDVPFWKAGSNQMGYPFGWSSLQIYYNPKYVTTKPDSWHALIDPKYAGKIVVENQPTDLMAMSGLATGAKSPYNMTNAEISRAKQFLEKFKPNVLKLVSQNTEVVNALADGSAWLAIENLGTDVRVKAAGGPRIDVTTAKEGTYGWMDAEMLTKSSKNEEAFMTFINTMEQAPWIAHNFLVNGRPLFNEKAYKLLVNMGKKEQADRFFYNKPETPLKMTLKGPSKNAQAYIDAFTQVFSA
jgi:spermidine/putrescine-binding protein